MEISDDIWSEIAFVSISKNRTKVLKYLEDYPKMPSQIAKGVDIKTNHVSNYLRDLLDHDLVVCINPEAKKGRLYRLTEKGEQVVKKI